MSAPTSIAAGRARSFARGSGRSALRRERRCAAQAVLDFGLTGKVFRWSSCLASYARDPSRAGSGRPPQAGFGFRVYREREKVPVLPRTREIVCRRGSSESPSPHERRCAAQGRFASRADGEGKWAFCLAPEARNALPAALGWLPPPRERRCTTQGRFGLRVDGRRQVVLLSSPRRARSLAAGSGRSPPPHERRCAAQGRFASRADGERHVVFLSCVTRGGPFARREWLITIAA
jgi:hypothetical protein